MSGLDLGGYYKDLDGGVYTQAWKTLWNAKEWIEKEEGEKGILFNKHSTIHNQAKKEKKWLDKHIWVCSRNGSGGKSKYVKKHPEQKRKVPTKLLKDGCPCRLVVRTYPNTEKVLGKYTVEHSHPIGDENLRFMRLPINVRLKIADLIRMGVSNDNILHS
jgi:hypothetical protein